MCHSTPIVLVGTQADRRRFSPNTDDVKRAVKKSCKSLVSQRKAERLADRIGAAAYVECSASDQTKVKDVFDTAIVVTLDQRGLLKCRQAKRGRKVMVDRGLDIGREDYKSTSVGKTTESEEQRKKQQQHQERHRWKRLLCCCYRWVVWSVVQSLLLILSINMTINVLLWTQVRQRYADIEYGFSAKDSWLMCLKCTKQIYTHIYIYIWILELRWHWAEQWPT